MTFHRKLFWSLLACLRLATPPPVLGQELDPFTQSLDQPVLPRLKLKITSEFSPAFTGGEEPPVDPLGESFRTREQQPDQTRLAFSLVHSRSLFPFLTLDLGYHYQMLMDHASPLTCAGTACLRERLQLSERRHLGDLTLRTSYRLTQWGLSTSIGKAFAGSHTSQDADDVLSHEPRTLTHLMEIVPWVSYIPTPSHLFMIYRPWRKVYDYEDSLNSSSNKSRNTSPLNLGAFYLWQPLLSTSLLFGAAREQFVFNDPWLNHKTNMLTLGAAHRFNSWASGGVFGRYRFREWLDADSRAANPHTSGLFFVYRFRSMLELTLDVAAKTSPREHLSFGMGIAQRLWDEHSPPDSVAAAHYLTLKHEYPNDYF